MITGPPKATDTKTTIKVYEEEIAPTKQPKSLCVIIDEQMNFNEHIREIGRKISQRLGVLKILCNILPQTLRMTIFRTIVLAYATFCSTVWHFARLSDLREIERIQENAMTITYFDKSSSYEKLITKANLPALQSRRIQDIAILMYKI